MSSATSSANLYDVLEQRGLVSQCTDEKIRERLSKPLSAYCGFDPTADSLHIGSLIPIMGLAHLQRCGHKPIILVGGATGLVGDPSGKSEARRMLSPEQINHNAQSIARQIGRIVDFDDSATGAVLVNNLDWIGPLTWLEVLRDIGSRVSVNRMVSMESVKQRMHGDGASESGISYLEFSYMLLQAYDFAHLFDQHRCTLQIGGQDQWGNIVMGIELGRKLHDADLAGLTSPLVTKSDGGKFGKSESGNVWLDEQRTSVFDFFQFWRNVADADVAKFLGYFTFIPMDEVRELASAQGAAINQAKVRLAYEVTRLVHGEHKAVNARDTAASIFANKDAARDAIPSAPISGDELEAGVGLLTLLVRSGFCKSNGEARRLIQGGGVRIHDDKVADPTRVVTLDDAVDRSILIRAGKKRLYRFDLTEG
ncbi:MAG: tyrosine--tRNA ligase [Planctomycetota bacterium]